VRIVCCKTWWFVILNAVKDLTGCVIESVSNKEDSCIIIFVRPFGVSLRSFVPQDDKQPELLFAICLIGCRNELGVVVKRKAEYIGAKIPVGFG
jgi:hypothetical protein